MTLILVYLIQSGNVLTIVNNTLNLKMEYAIRSYLGKDQMQENVFGKMEIVKIMKMGNMSFMIW